VSQHIDRKPGQYTAINVNVGPVAQWITRLTTDQKIPGSNPGRLELFIVNKFLLYITKILDMTDVFLLFYLFFSSLFVCLFFFHLDP
jgi:hypothetical protein